MNNNYTPPTPETEEDDEIQRQLNQYDANQATQQQGGLFGTVRDWYNRATQPGSIFRNITNNIVGGSDQGETLTVGGQTFENVTRQGGTVIPTPGSFAALGNVAGNAALSQMGIGTYGAAGGAGGAAGAVGSSVPATVAGSVPMAAGGLGASVPTIATGGLAAGTLAGAANTMPNIGNIPGSYFTSPTQSAGINPNYTQQVLNNPPAAGGTTPPSGGTTPPPASAGSTGGTTPPPTGAQGTPNMYVDPPAGSTNLSGATGNPGFWARAGSALGTGLKIGVGVGGTAVIGSSIANAVDRANTSVEEERLPGQDEQQEEGPGTNSFGMLEQSPDQVYQDTLNDIMANLENQQIGAQESYSNLYARALQNAYRRSAATTSPFTGISGGQPAQAQQALSAAEINQLGQIGQDYNQTMRDIESMGIAGQQEARQAAIDQYTLQQNVQERDYATTLRVVETLNDPNISTEDKRMLLNSLGMTDPAMQDEYLNLANENNTGWWQRMFDWIVENYRGATPTVNIQNYGTFGETID